MAIDDNTSYELTGAQVKDLANKIKAKADDNIFVGATSAIPGSKGLVPAPQAGDDTKFLSGDGVWKTVSQYSLPIASSSTLGGIKVGNNLTIDPSTGVLDAGGTTYTAGNGIDITNDEISIDTSVVAELSDIPTVNDSTITIQKNGTAVDSFTTNAAANKTINITVPTTAADVSALPASTKYGASLSLTINSSTYVVTGQLKDQDGNNLGTAQTIDLPLESVVVSGSYDSQTKEVVLTLQNGSTVRFSVADLVSGLQPTLTAGSNITIDSSTNTISATDTTYSNYTGATSLADGTAGLVPAPLAGDETKFLSGNGQWTTVSQYALPIATANDLGGIKVGTNLSIDSSTGVLSATDTTYTAGTNVQISAGNVISATDTTYSNFAGATSSVAGTNGLVPAPAAGDEGKALHGDGTWKETTAKLVEMSYGESSAWAKFIAAYNAGSIVYCRASSSANPGSGSQTRKAFMAYVNNAAAPTEVEFQYVRSVGTKTSSQPVDQVFVYKLTNANGGTWSVQTRDMAPKLAAGTNTSVSYSSGTYTVSATDTTYSNMTGATSGTAGAAGLVPAPAAGDQDKVLSGAGTWVAQSGGGSTYTAGNHIDITNDVISAEGYIWGDDAAPATTPASTITSAMIVDGTIQATDIATGVVPIITMTDTDPGEGSPLAANNFVAVYGEDPSNMNYSLTEAKTGATWIDGSPIYKKTINFGALPNNTTKSVTHSIANLEYVIRLEGTILQGTMPTGNFKPIPLLYSSGDSSYNTECYVDKNNISMRCSNNRANCTAYVTIYYTKSS